MTKPAGCPRVFSVVVSVVVFALLCGPILAETTLDKPVRFAILGDRTAGHVTGIYGQIVAEIERLKPDFVITVGDMIEDDIDDTLRIMTKWKEYDSLVAPLSAPLYLVPGNNDIWSDLSEELFTRRAGKPYRSFDYQNVHIIILDNSRWSNAAELPALQLEWLIDDLKQHQDAVYTLAFYHRPFWEGTVMMGKPDTLHNIFAAYGVDAVFTGHYHEYFHGTAGEILYTSIGSSGGECEIAPTGLEYHFAWVTLDRAGIHIAPVKLGSILPADHITVAEKFTCDRLKHFGLTFPEPLIIKDDRSPEKTRIQIRIDNSISRHALHDTLRWEIPENWEVEPQALPLRLAAGEIDTFNFIVTGHGDVYPVPRATAYFHHTETKSFPVTVDMRVARRAIGRFIEVPLVIDGVLSEAAWADPQTDFFDADGGPAQTDSTAFYFAYDEKNLYLGAFCRDSDVSGLVTDVTERDGPVHADDCVGYFLEPINGSGIVYQIYINPRGTIMDLELVLDEDGYFENDFSWNGEYEIKTARGTDFWSMEARIPWTQFGTMLTRGDKLRLNFRRKQKRLGTAADWQVPIGGPPDTYGELILQ